MADTPLLAIVGPTAVGKSRLALHLAQVLDGEIVNADSRQVYRGMDIGTAKPSAEERLLVPHHHLDIRNPDEEFNLALFLHLTSTVIHDIQIRGRQPLIVGGTGQYIWGLLEGWQVPKVAPNAALRADLELQAERRGLWVLYRMLQSVDPKVAKKTDPKNPRRVIRALEIHFARGPKPSKKQAKTIREAPSLILGLTMGREELYRKIDDRVDQMIVQDFFAEVKGLLERGYTPELPSMSGVGYREMAAHIAGELTLEEAIQGIKYHTHRIARRQYTWFRLNDPRIQWINVDGRELDVGLKMTKEFLAQCDKISSLGRPITG